MSEEIIRLADQQPDELVKQQIRERLRQSEQAPSVQVQTEGYKFFIESVEELGRPYDVTHIPLSVLAQMARDPMIAFGLHFIYAPIYRSRWFIECEDARIAAFVDNALRPILGRYLSQRAQAMAYGFKPIVKRFQLEIPNWTYVDPSKSDVPIRVWNNGNIEAITWKPFVGLPSDPNKVDVNFNKSDGSFLGIKWNGGQPPIPFANKTGKDSWDIDVQHSLWITNERESVDGSLWGYPRTGYAFRAWWSYWYQRALFDRFFERKADPTLQIYYPPAATKDDDDSVDSNKNIALEIASQARSGGVVALPNNVMNAYDQTNTSMREWEISEIPVTGTIDHFVESFEYLDMQKLRGLWLSELAFFTGTQGGQGRNVASSEIGLQKEAAAALADEIDEELNRWVIPDIVNANFPGFDGEVKKRTTGFTEADQESMQQALQWVIQGGATDQALEHMDIRALLDRLGMPLVSLKEISRQRKEAAKAIEESNPPVIDPDAGGNAGVNKAGFYVPGRASIVLSDAEDFIASLPNSKHFQDKQILSKAKALRSLWRESYKNIYDDFAKHLNQISFSDEADDLAEFIIKSWGWEREKIENLSEATKQLLRDVMVRAGFVELRRANLNTDWNTQAQEIAEYLEDRGAEFVKVVNDTTREELRTFLANEIRAGKDQEEIIEDVQKHFADFPDWKADRLVKSEIRNAYNMSTLFAGEQKGINVVQAKDAQLGPTDAECEERDGQFFKIAAAFTETLKEHPHGTLEWSLIPGRDNIDVVNATEMPDGSDSLAYFDDENSTVYIDSSLPTELRIEYLYTLGDQLSST